MLYFAAIMCAAESVANLAGVSVPFVTSRGADFMAFFPANTPKSLKMRLVVGSHPVGPAFQNVRAKTRVIVGD